MDIAALDALTTKIAAALPDATVTSAYGEVNAVVPANGIVSRLMMLRDNADLRFTTLIDITGVDYPDRGKRFDVVYHLLSLTQNQRLRVKVMTDEDTPVPSATVVLASTVVSGTLTVLPSAATTSVLAPVLR